MKIPAIDCCSRIWGGCSQERFQKNGARDVHATWPITIHVEEKGRPTLHRKMPLLLEEKAYNTNLKDFKGNQIPLNALYQVVKRFGKASQRPLKGLHMAFTRPLRGFQTAFCKALEGH